MAHCKRNSKEIKSKVGFVSFGKNVAAVFNQMNFLYKVDRINMKYILLGIQRSVVRCLGDILQSKCIKKNKAS